MYRISERDHSLRTLHVHLKCHEGWAAAIVREDVVQVYSRRRIAPELIAKVRQVKVFWHEQRLSTVMGMWVFYVKHFCPLGQTWLENMVQLTFSLQLLIHSMALL